MERDPRHGNHVWPLDGNMRPKVQLMEEKKEERPDDELRYLFYLYYFRTSLDLHLVKTYVN